MPIQTFEEQPGFAQRFAQGVSRGLTGQSENSLVGQFGQMAQQQRENQMIKQRTGLDLTGIRDPNTRQQLIADQLNYGRQLKQAGVDTGILDGGIGQNQNYTDAILSNDLSGGVENDVSSTRSRNVNLLPRVNMPNFGEKTKDTFKGQNNKFFPSNVGDEGEFGNIPQSETAGKKMPLLNPNELKSRASKIKQQDNANGIPTTAAQALEKARIENQLRSEHNQNVEADTTARREFQRDYHKIAQAKLNKILPDADPHVADIFMKRAEEYAAKNISEGEIKRLISQDMIKFKDNLSSFEKSIPSPDFLSTLGRKFMGTDRGDKAVQDMRAKMKPLLDMGLHDLVREKLAKKNYRIEARESIMSDLSENARKSVAQLSKVGIERKINFDKGFPDIPPQSYTPQEQEMIRDNIRNAVKTDPSANLILLRKAYGEKNVDWDVFKDVINEMIESGEFQPNDDQFRALDYLEEPPLDLLDRGLSAIKLIGT